MLSSGTEPSMGELQPFRPSLPPPSISCYFSTGADLWVLTSLCPILEHLVQQVFQQNCSDHGAALVG